MMSDAKKSWERPWYPKEIAENASNWSFGADLSLLKYLEVFSEDLLDKATAVDNNVNSLLDDLARASLSLDIAKNKFLSLSNTQFIESRVYEDDETIITNEEKIVKEEPNRNSSEEMNKNAMKLAASRGIDVINKYFEKVEVIDSDSEDENDLTSFVLRPKDPYIDRPLPYVIGTERWYKKLHVGLEDSSSENENENVSDKYSESDSESDLPITNRSQAKSISESGSSEADLSNKLDHPVANSTFNGTNKPEDFLGSSADCNSVPVQVPISQDSFAEQLAAKLGSVINSRAQEPTVNTRAIQKSSNYDRYGNMFSDEPPPLDDFNDELSPKLKDQGIFSGGDGLFDDLNDDESFWGGSVIEQQRKASNTIENSRPDQRTISKAVENNIRKGHNEKLNKMKESNIFVDEVESDDDSLFRKSNATTKTTYHNPQKQESLFDEDGDSDESRSYSEHSKIDDRSKTKERNSLFDDTDSINADTTKRKAPVGGIQVINNPNLFAGRNIKNLLKNNALSSSESSENEALIDEVDKVYDSTKETKNIKNEQEANIRQSHKQNKINSLFDDEDEDDFFKDDIFSNLSSKKINLFVQSDSLFDDPSESHVEDKSENIKSVYSAEKVEAPATGINSKEYVQEDFSRTNDISVNKGEVTPKEQSNKFRDSLERDHAKLSLDTENLFSTKPKHIFSTDDSDSDDLFSSKQSKVISKNRIIENLRPALDSSKTKLSKEIKQKSKKIPSLFDDDDDNEDGDLFSSNFVENKESASNLSKPKKKYIEDDRDNLFSAKGLLSDDDGGMFDNGKSFLSNLEETLKDKSGSLPADNLFKPEVLAQGANLNKTSLNNAEGDTFQNDNLTKKAVNSQLKSEKFKNKGVENNTFIDPLFADEGIEEDLFGIKSQKVSREKSQKSDKIIKEAPTLKYTFDNESSSKFEEKEPISTEEESSSRNCIDSYENGAAFVSEGKKLEIENKPAHNFEKSSLKEKKAEDIVENSGNNEIIAEFPPNLPQHDNSVQTIEEENVDLSADILTKSTDDRILSINIFDPNPPPDLDDWDTKSEQNIFDDDIYTFDNSENVSHNRSSVFDREPPSAFNESSGIVRDQSARLETDISSFYPYASSSRRLSSDLINEEQSSDSLLTTKNNLHSFEPANIPPSIVESSEEFSSNVDITPSGKLEDIYIEYSEVRQPKSVTFEDAIPKKSDEEKASKRDIDKTKTKDDMETSQEEYTEEVNNAKPKPALPGKPNLKISGQESSSSQKFPKPKTQEYVESQGSPGKLKHNLHINVLALLPGAGKAPKREAPPERKHPTPPQRSISLNFEEQKTTDTFQEPASPRESKDTLDISKNNFDNVEVLESVNKTRAKGPIKRRPSTKRGREAIRNSCIDFTFVTNPTENHQTPNTPKDTVRDETQSFRDEAKFIEPSQSMSRQTDFMNIEKGELESDLPSNRNAKIEVSIKNEDSPRSSIPEISPKNLFNDDTDSDDLFSGLESRKLFEDEASDDIFRQKRVLFPSDSFPGFASDNQTSRNGHPGSLDQNPKRIENLAGTTGIKRTADETSAQNEFKSNSSINDQHKTGVPKKMESTRKKDLFEDDTDDDDLFLKSKKPGNTLSTSKLMRSEGSDVLSGTSRSSIVKSDNFVFSDDEEGDIFSARNHKRKEFNVPKRLPFDVSDDDEDSFGQTSKDKQQVISTASITSKRLKSSTLKKLENTILTEDDPLNALNN